jgi:hypothetical protein
MTVERPRGGGALDPHPGQPRVREIVLSLALQ